MQMLHWSEGCSAYSMSFPAKKHLCQCVMKAYASRDDGLFLADPPNGQTTLTPPYPPTEAGVVQGNGDRTRRRKPMERR